MPRIICYRSHSETPFHGVSFYFPSILSLLLFFIFINSLSFSLSFLSRFFSCSQPFTGFLLFQHTFRLFSFICYPFFLCCPLLYLFVILFIYHLLTYLLIFLLTPFPLSLTSLPFCLSKHLSTSLSVLLTYFHSLFFSIVSLFISLSFCLSFCLTHWYYFIPLAISFKGSGCRQRCIHSSAHRRLLFSIWTRRYIIKSTPTHSPAGKYYHARS